MVVRRNGPGFTLIELLIGIAIVATLAAIGVPTYLGLVQRAREAAVSQYLREVHKGQLGWRMETDSNGFTGDFDELEKSGFIPDAVSNVRFRWQLPRRNWSVELSVRQYQTYNLQLVSQEVSGTATYYVYAYPQSMNPKARWLFIDQTGVIRGTTGWAGPGAPPI